MSCFPEMYLKQGIKNHRSCASNIAEVMEPYGMKSYLEVTGQCIEFAMVCLPFTRPIANVFLEEDPFNIFQNTPNYTLKPLGSSKAGDYIELEALKDIVAAASCCPYDLGGFNGGKVTDVAVVTGLGAVNRN